jgi:predicted P-loop ATPase
MEMATEVVMQRTATDPWEAEVLPFVRNKHEVSSRDIFKHLNIDLPQRSQVFEKRVLGIITRAGWTKDGRFWSGDNRATARYVPPVRWAYEIQIELVQYWCKSGSFLDILHRCTSDCYTTLWPHIYLLLKYNMR